MAALETNPFADHRPSLRAADSALWKLSDWCEFQDYMMVYEDAKRMLQVTHLALFHDDCIFGWDRESKIVYLDQSFTVVESFQLLSKGLTSKHDIHKTS